MSTEIKHAVVIDNKDIYETGKIRVLILSDIPSGYRNKSINELKILLSNIDAKGNHNPWQKSSATKVADPYLAEPFLPRQINMIPQEGQLVKLMIYPEANFMEYVGPHVSSLENPKEGYVNAINSFKVLSKKDLITNGFVNKVSDNALFGPNTQLILSDKELFLRTNFQNYNGKKKNTDLAMMQLSSFDTTMTLEKKNSTSVFTPERLISHLLQVKIEKKVRNFLNEKTITATITLNSILHHKNSDGKTGVTDRTYDPTKDYTSERELVFELITDDANEITKFITELQISLLNKNVSQLATLTPVGDYYQTTVSTPAYDLNITDMRTMGPSFTEIENRKEVDVISLVVAVDKAQVTYDITDETLESLGISAQYITTAPKLYAKEKSNLTIINTLVRKYRDNHKVESKILNATPQVIQSSTSEVKLNPKADSYTVHGSDKILLMSTQVTPNLISDNPSQYGLTQKELAELVDPTTLKTYSTLRGEPLIQIINYLIDLFISHGHSTGNTVKNSLEEDTKAKLLKIKEDLSKKVNTDLSGGTDILNQYIRIN